MFVDHEPSLVPQAQPAAAAPELPVAQPSRTKLYIVGGAILVILIGGGSWWFLASRNGSAPVEQKPPVTEPTGLPETLNPNPDDVNGANGTANDFKGETVTFDAYYKSLADEKLDLKAAGVKLPLNVKSQVSNYYEVARRLELDPAVANLNKNGFALIDNPLGESGNDFFAAYAELNRRGVPFLVTNDFLMYYYQNSLKQIYDEVKASYFYDSLWNVNKELFEAANSRYQERRQKVGVSNDPLLEAERLEAGYFATSLALLTPRPEQVNVNEEINETKTFKPSEAKRYQFTAPAYLTEDITRELALITAAKQSDKSPLFLYLRDYTDFKIPVEYAENAKLKNYFQASRWQSSLFPLDFKDAGCPNCLLDRDDWTINQLAAYLVAEDLSSRQPLKNEWAKIYKVTAFFTGLRSDLTYLDYQSVREELFAKKTVDEIFGSDARTKLIALTERLEKKSFTPAAGGLNRSDLSQRPLLGLRLLQTAFWPDHYIYDRLTNEAVGSHNQPRNARGDYNQYLTGCISSKEQRMYRCRGIGFDLLAAVGKNSSTSAYVSSNINYQRYSAARDQLQKEIAALPAGARHGSNFWSTLDIAAVLSGERFSNFPYSELAPWSERQLSAGLAALTNLSLPADSWESARVAGTPNLGSAQERTLLSYVEPNRRLSDELVANAEMVYKSLTALGVVRDNDARFTELIGKLKNLRAVARAELSGEKLTPEVYQGLADVVGQYKTVRSGAKSSTVYFTDPFTKRELKVKQTTAPLKLLLLVYAKDGQNILVAGPVFAYTEE